MRWHWCRRATPVVSATRQSMLYGPAGANPRLFELRRPGAACGVDFPRRCHRIACVRLPGIRPQGARNATRATFTTGCELYGSGLRLLEGLRLRVKDLDFEYGQIQVRDGKGGKDRLTMLPERLTADLARHLEEVRQLHAKDLRLGFGNVKLPKALARISQEKLRKGRYF